MDGEDNQTQNPLSEQKPPPEEPVSMQQSLNKTWITLGIIIIAAILGIGGYFWLSKKPVEPSSTITPPQVKDEGVDTKGKTSDLALSGVEGWKTYRNEKYGFEIRYPSAWVDTTKDYEKEQGRYTFSDSLGMEEGGIAFGLTIGSDINLFDSLKKLQPQERFERDLVVYTKIADLVVAGLQAVRYSADRSVIPALFLPMGDEVLSKKDGSTFHFVLIGLPNAVQESELTFKQILSAFKFIEPM